MTLNTCEKGCDTPKRVRKGERGDSEGIGAERYFRLPREPEEGKLVILLLFSWGSEHHKALGFLLCLQHGLNVEHSP